MTRSEAPVLVLGAGFAGLATAVLLRRAGQRAVVLEPKKRAGGKALTVREDGFVVEQGPLGWLNREPAVLDALDFVGAEPIEADPGQKRRFLLHRGRLEALPGGPGALLRTPLLSRRGRLRFLTEFARRQGGDEDESVHDFASRRFGEEAADALFEAFVSGVFAGDPRRLAARASFPLFARFEREHGSVMRGGLAHMRALRRARRERPPAGLAARFPRGTLLSMPRGMAQLAAVLAESLGQDLRLGARPVALDREGAGWRVRLESGEEVAGHAIVCAGPAADSARLVGGLAPSLTDAAAGIPHASLAVLTLAYRTADVARPLDGFGFLAPRREGFRPLGVQCAHAIFPSQTPDGWSQLRVMLGGELDPGALELDDDALLAAALRDLRPLLGLPERPARVWLKRWHDAVPQYVAGHARRVATFDAAEQALPGLHFAGDGLHGVGVPAAFARASALVERIAPGRA